MLLGGLLALILQVPAFALAGPTALPAADSGLSDLGTALVDVNRFLLPFEVASVLLLAALIGAMAIARPADKAEEGARMIPLSWYLILSALLFCIGVFGVLARRNAVGILMGIELMLNAVNLNLVAFWRYLTPTADRRPGLHADRLRRGGLRGRRRPGLDHLDLPPPLDRGGRRDQPDEVVGGAHAT